MHRVLQVDLRPRRSDRISIRKSRTGVSRHAKQMIHQRSAFKHDLEIEWNAPKNRRNDSIRSIRLTPRLTGRVGCAVRHIHTYKLMQMSQCLFLPDFTLPTPATYRYPHNGQSTTFQGRIRQGSRSFTSQTTWYS